MNSQSVTSATASRSYDMSRILRVTKALQTEFTCKNCHQHYPKKWCKEEDTLCYFCTHFLPMRDTYTTILKDIDWHYYRSGETTKSEFVKQFLDNLAKWAQRFHVLKSKQDEKTIEELRAEQDWSREYWH